MDTALDIRELVLLADARKYESVISRTAELIGKTPEIPLFHFLRAVAFNESGRLTEATEAYLNGLALGPNADAFSNLGLVYEKLGRANQAIECYRNAIDTNSEHVAALNNLNNHLIGLGQTDELVATCKKLLTLQIDAPTILNITRQLGELGRLDSTTSAVTLDGVEKAVLTGAAAGEEHGLTLISTTPSLAVAGGTQIFNVTARSAATSEVFFGQPSRLYKTTLAKCLWPNLLFTEAAFLDAGNGYSSLENLGHPHYKHHSVSVGVSAGKLHFEARTTSAPRIVVNDSPGYLTADLNYSAWLLGELPRVGLYRSASPSCKIVLHGKAQPFHFDSLLRMGVTADQVINVDQSAIVCGPLLFATPTYLHHNMSLGDLAIVRERIRSKRGAEIGNGPRLYVSRSRLAPAHDRRIQNETALEVYLSDQGFEVIHPQEMTFNQQVSAFASADTIIAPFGAALANSIFCRDDARVCVLMTKMMPEFNRLYQWIGLDVSHIFPKASPINNSQALSKAFEFVVDFEDVRRFLDQQEIAGPVS